MLAIQGEDGWCDNGEQELEGNYRGVQDQKWVNPGGLSSNRRPSLTNLVTELESIRTSLTEANTTLQTELDAIKARAAETSDALDDAKRYGSMALSVPAIDWVDG